MARIEKILGVSDTGEVGDWAKFSIECVATGSVGDLLVFNDYLECGRASSPTRIALNNELTYSPA
jgi:hypothetical protein